jgi:hypothetical protein
MTNIRGIAIRVAVSAFLTSAALPAFAQTVFEPDQLRLAYLVNLAHGSLDAAIDRLHAGPIDPGNTKHDGINATWSLGNGTIILGVTRPSSYTGAAPVASGLFVTPVAFGTGSVFAARASFRAPSGPRLTGNQFAVVLAARTGEVDDLPGETRVGASFQVRGTTARLNVVGATPPVPQPNMPQEVYDAIFDPANPLPFTLDLIIDRVSGVGKATLSAGDYKASTTFQSVFNANSGDPISAVGASIAIANGSDQRGTVEVMGLRILTPNANASSSATSCDPAWAEFGCRQPPSQ